MTTAVRTDLGQLRGDVRIAARVLAPFVGDDRPLTHLLRVLRNPGIRVQVKFLTPITSSGLDRKGMAEACRRSIGGALGLP